MIYCILITIIIWDEWKVFRLSTQVDNLSSDINIYKDYYDRYEESRDDLMLLSRDYNQEWKKQEKKIKYLKKQCRRWKEQATERR